MSTVIQAGVIGYGLSAKVFHLPFLRSPYFKLTGLVERKEGGEASRDYAKQVNELKSLKIHRSLDDMLNEDIHNDKEAGKISAFSVDLVVICTPPETHFAFAQKALLAGKHVVVEKPMCSSFEEAEKLAQLAQEKGLVLAVYQNRRFDSDFMTVKQLLEAGKLGNIVEYEANYDRFRRELKDGGNSWKEGDLPGNGLLFDLGSHLIDQAITLFGTPSAVTGKLFYQREGTKIVDAFHVSLHYSSQQQATTTPIFPVIKSSLNLETEGLVVTLKAGMLIASPRPRFALYGTSGSFVKYGLDVQEPQLKNGGTIDDENYGVEPESDQGFLKLIEGARIHEERVPTERGDYGRFYQQLAASILGNNARSKCPVDPWSAVAVIAVIEKAQKSHALNRTVFWNEEK